MDLIEVDNDLLEFVNDELVRLKGRVCRLEGERDALLDFVKRNGFYSKWVNVCWEVKKNGL